jgi:hypothetical protein
MICLLYQWWQIIGETIKIEMFNIMQQHNGNNGKSPQGINNAETCGSGIQVENIFYKYTKSPEV